jgi:hypothetical protein
MHVLQVYAHEARTKPESRQWFNGETNWRRDNFDRALGRVPATGAAAPARRSRGPTADDFADVALRLDEEDKRGAR